MNDTQYTDIYVCETNTEDDSGYTFTVGDVWALSRRLNVSYDVALSGLEAIQEANQKRVTRKQQKRGIYGVQYYLPITRAGEIIRFFKTSSKRTLQNLINAAQSDNEVIRAFRRGEKLDRYEVMLIDRLHSMYPNLPADLPKGD